MYAHKMGCECDERTTRRAAQKGHLHCLKYLHENGVPWDYNTLQGAAREGHIDCLEYAFANGCVPDWWTIYYAARNNQRGTLRWAMERGFPWHLTDDTEDITIRVWVEIRMFRALTQYAEDMMKQYRMRTLHEPTYLRTIVHKIYQETVGTSYV